MNDSNALALARQTWKKNDRATIAKHHGIDPDHNAFWVLLSFCAKYNLDPLGGHVWLVDKNFDRAEAKDGAPLPDDAELDVAVTRDGFLTIARRDPSYQGMDFDAVRSKDEFRVVREGGNALIHHAYPDLPEGGEDVGSYRGEIVGAYCQVYVYGRRATYYFAWWNEHGQFRWEGDERIPEGTWATHPSAMIIKAAQSVALRLALGITGVVGIDEVRRGTAEPLKAPDPIGEFESPRDFLLSLDLPDDLREPLVDMVEAANAKTPNSWSLAKLRMRLGSPDPETVLSAAERTLAELEREAPHGAPESAEADVPGDDEETPASASVPASTAP